MAILTKSGRVAIAESLSIRPLHIAWGAGNGSWTTPPAEDVEATALLNEVGRRVVAEASFVNADPTGDIVLPTGTFKRSLTPTRNLYVRATFDFTEAQSSVIREVGVFVGTETNPALPPGQEYFLPADVVEAGRLLHLENLPPIFRSPAIRESFEIVVAF